MTPRSFSQRSEMMAAARSCFMAGMPGRGVDQHIRNNKTLAIMKLILVPLSFTHVKSLFMVQGHVAWPARIARHLETSLSSSSLNILLIEVTPAEAASPDGSGPVQTECNVLFRHTQSSASMIPRNLRVTRILRDRQMTHIQPREEIVSLAAYLHEMTSQGGSAATVSRASRLDASPKNKVSQ